MKKIIGYKVQNRTNMPLVLVERGLEVTVLPHQSIEVKPESTFNDGLHIEPIEIDAIEVKEEVVDEPIIEEVVKKPVKVKPKIKKKVKKSGKMSERSSVKTRRKRKY